MVTMLLTNLIRVNVPSTAESQFEPNRGKTMVKKPQGKWSFWNWLLGSGVTGAGSGG